MKDWEGEKIYRIRRRGREYLMKRDVLGKNARIIVEMENEKESEGLNRFIIKVKEIDGRYKKIKVKKEHKGKEIKIGRWIYLYDSSGREVFAAPVDYIYKQKFTYFI